MTKSGGVADDGMGINPTIVGVVVDFLVFLAGTESAARFLFIILDEASERALRGTLVVVLTVFAIISMLVVLMLLIVWVHEFKPLKS